MLDLKTVELPAFKRHRRLRGSAAIRDMIRETELTPRHLIYPLFIEAGTLRAAADPLDAGTGSRRTG